MKKLFRFLLFAMMAITTSFQEKNTPADQLRGSWILQSGDEEMLLLFIDGYVTHTVYSKSARKFIETRGGKYSITGNSVDIQYEFHTKDKEQVGQSRSYNFSINNGLLNVQSSDRQLQFKRVDDGSAPLTGVWHITSRMQDGKIVPIHRSGTRKTIKILSGTHFQWAAIDPGSKDFHGTGGGRYTFENGKYTEHIEFFSRDSSRVGASLTFDGKLEQGEWHHSGVSSRGDKIYEIWSKVGK